VANKATSFQETPDDIKYPSEKLVKDALDEINRTFTENGEPNGFVDPANEVTESFNNTTRTLTLTPAIEGGFVFYSGGKRFVKTVAESVSIADTSGVHYIFYNDLGVLTADMTFNAKFIVDYAMVAIIAWEAVAGKQIYFGREHLHTTKMGGYTHLQAHLTDGFKLESGGLIQDYVVDGDGSLDTSCQFGISATNIWDEDAGFNFSARSNDDLLPIFYREGAGGTFNWKIKEDSNFPVILTTGVPSFNEKSDLDVWSLTPVTDEFYYLIHIASLNDSDRPYAVFLGQKQYGDIDSARNGATTELNDMELEGIPLAEFKFLATMIVETSTTFGNSVTARLHSITTSGVDFIDWRFIVKGRSATFLTPVLDSTKSRVNTYYLSKEGGHFSVLSEMVEFFDSQEALGRTEGLEIIVDAGHYPVNDTILFEYSYPITIRGSGSNNTFFEAQASLDDKQMFLLKSEANFTRMTFDGSTYPAWKDKSNAICLCVQNSDIYFEVTDFVMKDASRGFCIQKSSSAFIFNFIIENMREVGIGFAEPVLSGGEIDAEIGNITNCGYGINLLQGIDVKVHLAHLIIDSEAGQVGLNYVGADFTYNRFDVQSILFRGAGTPYTGFDFTLERDADIEFQVLMGTPSIPAFALAKVTDGDFNTTCTDQNTWYKAVFTNTEEKETKFTVANNLLTYLSTYKKGMNVFVTVNVSANSNNRNLRIGIWKNGLTGSLEGAFTGRLSTANQPYTISFVIHVAEMVKDDYLEIYYTCTNSSGVVMNTKEVEWMVQEK
jgi:hypothetical protein